MKLRVKPRPSKQERAHLTREGERKAAQHLCEQNLRLLLAALERTDKKGGLNKDARDKLVARIAVLRNEK